MSKLRFVFIAVFAFCAAVAVAGPESIGGFQRVQQEDGAFVTAVGDSFPSPGSEPMGVDWIDSGGGIIYHVDLNNGNVYAITSQGSAELLFNIGVQLGIEEPGRGNGICYVQDALEGGCLYITALNGQGETFEDMVYKFALDGTLLGSWNVESLCSMVMGICFDGTHFYLSCLAPSDIIKCDASFAEVARHASPGTAGGIDYDPVLDCFYMSDYFIDAIHVLDSELSEILAMPGRNVSSCGIAVGRTTRGRTLWFSEVSHDVIYEIDDVYFNDITPVERTTWGLVKALHRD